MPPLSRRRGPLIAWLPYPAREALEHLRRPGLSSLERALAASIVVNAVETIFARGQVSQTFASLIEDEIQWHIRDLVEPEDVRPQLSP